MCFVYVKKNGSRTLKTFDSRWNIAGFHLLLKALTALPCTPQILSASTSNCELSNRMVTQLIKFVLYIVRNKGSFQIVLTNNCSDDYFLFNFVNEKDNICNMTCSKNNELISSTALW